VVRMKYPSLPFNEYLALKDTISTSEMKVLLESPRKYYHQYIMGLREDKEAFRTGRFLHTAVLEPHELEKRYAIAPEINRRTNIGKAEWREFVESCGDKEVLSQADAILGDAISTALKEHQIEPSPGEYLPLLSLFAGCEMEVSYVGELDGVPVRVRPDAINHTSRYIMDLKFVKDASPDGFAKACANFGYTLQASNYMDVVEQVEGEPYRFLFIAVEKSAPHEFGIYELEPGDVEGVGRTARTEALELYRLCKERPEVFKRSYTRGIMQLALPGWVYQARKED
jgi:hypothetical protein